MSTPTPTLQHCPFCGSTASLYPDGDMEGHAVLCDGNLDPDRLCPHSRFAYDTADEAIAARNLRASLPAPQGEQRTPGELLRQLDAMGGIGAQAADVIRSLMLVNVSGAIQDSRTSSIAPGGLPLAQADGKVTLTVDEQGALKRALMRSVKVLPDGDSVPAPVEPPGATLSPCAASQWISVDERLPPLNTEVLIAFDTSPLPATGQLTMYRGIRQWCWPAENDPVGDESLRAVTHWAFMRHPSEIGEWTPQVDRGESSSEGGES